MSQEKRRGGATEILKQNTPTLLKRNLTPQLGRFRTSSLKPKGHGLKKIPVKSNFNNTPRIEVEKQDDDEDQALKDDEDYDDDQKIERKIDRQEVDFTQQDNSNRINIIQIGNILHRACIDQQKKIIEDIINEYMTVLKNKTEEEKKSTLSNYINCPDKFNCKPLLLTCFKESYRHEDSRRSDRYDCLSFLIKNGAQVNTTNPRTMWSPLHWCCHYGDYDSVQILLENGIITYMTDYKGSYPIDLAGRKAHKQIVDLLFRHLLRILQEFEDNLVNRAYAITEERKLEFKQNERWLQTPLLRCKLLYWGVTFHLEMKYLLQLMSFPRTYIFSPIQSEKNLSPIHAAASLGIESVLQQLIDTRVVWQTAIAHKYGSTILPQRVLFNNIFSVGVTERYLFRQEFYDQVISLAKWEQQFLSDCLNFSRHQETRGQLTENEQKKFILQKYINQQEFYGNSPLHLASLKGNQNIVRMLIKFGANMEFENKEIFKARELTHSEYVRQVYKDQIQQIDQKEVLQTVNNNLINTMNEFFKGKKKTDEYRIVQMMNNRVDGRADEEYQRFIKSLLILSDKIFVPDFVLKCRLKQVTKGNQTATFFDLESSDNAELQRLNFQISMLQNANFEVYLMKSFYEEGFYYIMLRHQDENLELQAQLMNLQVKLMDSYDLEPFQKKFQQLFEPFRSRQRQEIIEAHFKKVVNLNELLRAEIVEQAYRMHTFGGMQKIKHQWIEKPKWYLPQPINQLDDYLKEGSAQNFTSITVLRLYLGEKISFFFAWKSYITCALLAVAIPGLCLQIYILKNQDYNPGILPYWVFYVCIWNTLQVEFWKRKTSEISTRWGSLDLLEEDDSEEQIREGFSGDEEIYEVTGDLTKHQVKAETILKLLVSIPILTFFIALCIVIFVGIDLLKQQKNTQTPILQTTLSVLQGVAITTLNISYTLIAKWFVEKENHKYEQSYESSMIYKNAAFKFLNSYLPIIYAAFYKTTSTLESIFSLMLPVLIVKQINYMILDVFLPQLMYKRKEYLYFQKLNKIIQLQSQVGSEKNKVNSYKDICELFWKFLFKKETQSTKRAVIKLNTAEQNNKGFSEETKISLESNLDADAVELNSLKLDFQGTMNYFMEGIIDIGYITLFTAAFPIGPFLSLLASILELKMKLYSFLYVYKRPQTQRCAGIGDWLDILEIMSVVSVFSNFGLLYLKARNETVKDLYGYEETVNDSSDDSYSVWLFILSILILLALKMFFQWIIPDRPEWVQKEMERMNAKNQNQTGSAETVRQAQTKLIELQGKVEKATRIYEAKKQAKRDRIKRKKQQQQENKRVDQEINNEVKDQKIEQEQEKQEIKTKKPRRPKLEPLDIK